MGNYSCRRGEKILVGWEIDVAQLVFQGKSNRDIAVEIFNADPDNPSDMRKKTNRIKRLLTTEKFEAYYKSMVTEWTVHNVGKALTKLAEQLDNKQPWLVNKAANDILLRAPKGILNDDDENAVVVRFEGMPEIGVPDE